MERGQAGAVESEGEAVDTVAGERIVRRPIWGRRPPNSSDVHLDRLRPDPKIEAFGLAVREGDKLDRPRQGDEFA